MMTDQEKIALQMLSTCRDLISINMQDQHLMIGNALDFADYFLSISRADEVKK